MEKITILITDNLTMVRQSLEVLLNIDPRFKVIALAATGEQAIELTMQLHPDIVLMDINLPGINGIEATQAILKVSTTTKIIGVSMQAQPYYVNKMMQKGAKGYVTKNSSAEELRNAIIEVYHNRKYICEEMTQSLANSLMNECGQQSALKLLSNREIEVIDFIKKGFSYKEISNSLKICYKTVQTHRYNILKKLNLKDTSALVNYINGSQLATTH